MLRSTIKEICFYLGLLGFIYVLIYGMNLKALEVKDSVHQSDSLEQKNLKFWDEPEKVDEPEVKQESKTKIPEELSSLIEKDEPVVFLPELFMEKPKILQEQKVESQKKILMDKDNPLYIPLFFDPEKNGINYAHQEIEYDLTDPLILRIGPLSVTAAGISLRMSRENGEFFDFEFALDLKKKFANMYMLSFQWPLDLIPEGNIEFLNDHGTVLWRHNVTENKISQWHAFVNSKQKTAMVSNPRKNNHHKHRLNITGHNLSSFGFFGKDIFYIPFWKIKEPFRFCISKESIEGRIALCSKRYHFIRKGGRFWALTENKIVQPKVTVNDRTVTRKGSALFVDENKSIKFSAMMGNGSYFEFVSRPKKINIVDMVLNEKSNEIEIIGYDLPPLGPISPIERIASDPLDFLNFAPTIGDFRQFWKAIIPVGGNLFLRGNGGAPFKQPFVYAKLPRKTIRPRILLKSPKATYSRTVRLKGEITEAVTISSSQQVAHNISPRTFTWDFLAQKPGAMNSARLEVFDGKQKLYAFHEIYRGFPRDLSLRTTGVLTNNLEVVVLGEISGQWWFEKILGWNNEWLSLQRWGVSGKYFKAIAGFGGGANGQSIINLDVNTYDLKYRLSPGIWGRDPTLGIMANYQTVTIEKYQASMGGAGVFWARSLPKFFDQIFNIVPFMRYPKWVDVESIFYFMPGSSHTRLGINSAINFHGKVMWTPQFFGEGGFGFKLFQFDDLTKNKSVGLAVAYGTIGVGYNF
ncbi:MAG: hypothetical protein K1X29_08905 [Bdellovibrionales bacterium]|nr:hypothetical protein [Bdellovibrionales bacterium]